MQAIFDSAFHPTEIAALLKYKLNEKPQKYRTRDELPEKDSKDFSYAISYFFLNHTSRSFTRVIQSLDEELKHTICIFYRTISL
jgi:hypothetical protein